MGSGDNGEGAAQGLRKERTQKPKQVESRSSADEQKCREQGRAKPAESTDGRHRVDEYQMGVDVVRVTKGVREQGERKMSRAGRARTGRTTSGINVEQRREEQRNGGVKKGRGSEGKALGQKAAR